MSGQPSPIDEKVYRFIFDPTFHHKENLSGRVRTACINCKRKVGLERLARNPTRLTYVQKIKCNGQVPCVTCREKNISCEGFIKRRRPSHSQKRRRTSDLYSTDSRSPIASPSLHRRDALLIDTGPTSSNTGAKRNATALQSRPALEKSDTLDSGYASGKQHSSRNASLQQMQENECAHRGFVAEHASIGSATINGRSLPRTSNVVQRHSHGQAQHWDTSAVMTVEPARPATVRPPVEITNDVAWAQQDSCLLHDNGIAFNQEALRSYNDHLPYQPVIWSNDRDVANALRQTTPLSTTMDALDDDHMLDSLDDMSLPFDSMLATDWFGFPLDNFDDLSCMQPYSSASNPINFQQEARAVVQTLDHSSIPAANFATMSWVDSPVQGMLVSSPASLQSNPRLSNHNRQIYISATTRMQSTSTSQMNGQQWHWADR